MPWSGSTFSRSNGVNTGSTTWQQDRDAGTKILATRHDTHDQDVADGINACLKKDGGNAATGDLDLGGNRFTNAGDGTARDDLSTVGQFQDGDNVWADAGGTADAITATYSPAITTLVDGMELRVRAAAANATTTPTFSPNGLTARTIVKTGGNALVAGDIAGDGHELILRYESANTRWELLNPASDGISALVDDTTPQLGGDLDLNGNAIDFPSTANISDVLDEDDMVSDSATALATQQSIKAYVDASAGATAAESAKITQNANNIAYLGMRLAIAEGFSVFEMDKAALDEFEDESGVDTTASTNENYSAANDWYSSSSNSLVSGGTGTAIGSASNKSEAFDGDDAETNSNSARNGSGKSTTVGKDWDAGGGETKAIGRVVVTGPTDGFGATTADGTVTVEVYTTTDGTASGGTLVASDSKADGSSVVFDLDITSPSDTRSIYVSVSHDGSDNNCGVSEVEFYEKSVADMTLVSEAVTADSAPSVGRAIVTVDPVDAITINTDLLADISRDDGSTWSVGTLAAVGTFGDYTVYATGEIDISGQPSGTSVRIRVRTANTKEIRVKAWTRMWRT